MPFRTHGEMRAAYVEQAKAEAQRLQASSSQQPAGANRSFTAPARQLGIAYGMGVGLYLRLLVWLSWIFFLLALSSVPFLVTINLSVFTDYVHRDSYEFGVKVYDPIQASSFSFAAIVSSSVDNNTLLYMNTNIANTWKGPMLKSTFLKWISYVDAAVSAVVLLCSVALLYLSRRFLRSMDRRCLEVSDYTVSVKGLPKDVSPQQVLNHFERFGDVVEAQLVSDVASILRVCSKVSELEQQAQVLKDMEELEEPGTDAEAARVHARALEVDRELESKLSAISQNPVVNNEVKLVFVTFNDLPSMQRCLTSCWGGCLLSCCMPHSERFQGTIKFWVKKAAPPEDYIYENLSMTRTARLARKALTRIVILLMLIVTAAIVTLLSNISATETNSIDWLSDSLNADVTSSLPTILTDRSATAAANVTLQAAVCAALLPSTCTAYYGAQYGSTLQMQYGSLLSWLNLTEGLINLRPTIQAMQSGGGGGSAGVHAC